MATPLLTDKHVRYPTHTKI